MLSTLNIRSNTHNSCEDTVLVKHHNEFIYGGVFDGCSTGIKSHWASQTLSYLFENEIDPTDGTSIYRVWNELKVIKDILGLTHMNLLSTCLLFQYNTETKLLKVRAFGDGYYYVNDVEYEILQNNTPDYLGYYVSEGSSQFINFLERYPVKVYPDVESFKICSDGIKAINISQYEVTDIDPIAKLFHPPTSENYLERTWNILKRKHFTLSDDLSIISYANSP